MSQISNQAPASKTATELDAVGKAVAHFGSNLTMNPFASKDYFVNPRRRFVLA
jgi:hypothetical protein